MVKSLTILNLYICGYDKRIKIIDKETGLSFMQMYTSHKKGLRPNSQIDYATILYVRRANSKFNNRYKYSNYSGFNKPVTIFDTETNQTFEQNAQDHLNGAKSLSTILSFRNYETFLEESRKVHGNRFEYLEYDWDNRRVKIKDTVTGFEYIQIIYEHLKGYYPRGCIASRNVSRKEKQIRKEVVELYPDLEVQFNKRFLWLDNKELDIYIPNLNLAIEVNGSSFHQSNPNIDNEFLKKSIKPIDYHVWKFNTCKENGIKLIHIFDFDTYTSLKDLIEKYLNSDITVIENEKVCVNSRGNILKKYSETARHVYRPVYKFVNK